MTKNQIRETAGALLIDTEGRFLFQRRDKVAGILYPGKIGLFGGHREGSETFLQCACREVHEEISYRVPEEAFHHLGWYKSVQPDGVKVLTGIFVARDIPVGDLTITEGSLLVSSRENVPALIEQMSPSARTAFEMLTSGTA